MFRLTYCIVFYFFISIFSLADASNKKAAIVIDFHDNQKVIFSENATAHRHPASLTKIMTVYLLFDAIKKQQITFNTKFKVSRLASIQMPSKLGLKVGEKISVIDAIKALVVKSANDVAVVVAEGLCGSVANFCTLMNKQAKMIGMINTHFENPSGVPNPRQISTAKDMATLLISVYKRFPQYWGLFSLKSFVYKKATHRTHCKILHWYKGADGAKTGYVAASGFNLAVTANRYNKDGNSKRLFVVVMGRESFKVRDLYAAKLMNQYFGDYKISTTKQTYRDEAYTMEQRQSLLRQADKADLLEPVVQEEEEVWIDDILKESAVDKNNFDKLYAADEEAIQIEEEVFVEPPSITTKKDVKKKIGRKQGRRRK